MRLFTLFSLFFTFTVILSSANSTNAQSVSIASWRYDSKSAYSIIMDDYANFFSDAVTVDTILLNRKLNVSFAVIVNSSPNWNLAKKLFSEGNEFINHSWDHAPSLDASQFPLQIDSSKARIEKMIPGNKCLFYAFPGGAESQAKVDYMRNKEYVGVREFSGDPNAITIPDPFKIRSALYFGGTIDVLNSYVDDAVAKGGWAVRSTHNVNDADPAGQAAPIPTRMFADHLTYVKKKVDTRDVWMAPVQQVLKYVMERSNYTTSVKTVASGLEITFTTDSKKINPSPLVPNTLYDYPLTLKVTLPSSLNADNIKISQGIETIPYVKSSSTSVRFDAKPYNGVITISNQSTSIKLNQNRKSEAHWKIKKTFSKRSSYRTMSISKGNTKRFYSINGTLSSN